MTELMPLPGDFACVSMGGEAGRLVALGERLNGDAFTQYQHAFVYMGASKIVEAEPGGAQERPLQGYGSIVWSTGKIPLTAAQRGKIVAAAAGYIGTDYSFLDYFALAARRLHIPVPGLRRYIASTGHMICSQLVSRCYLDAGVPLFPGEWTGYNTPADLAAILI